jgi:protein phosphatase 2C family protein 2/3
MAGVTIVGPVRVKPGKLSVSRTFGDVTAKFKKYGGNPKGVIVDPEIFKIVPNSKTDFIMMGSDGIFDRIESEEVSEVFWQDA